MMSVRYWLANQSLKLSEWLFKPFDEESYDFDSEVVVRPDERVVKPNSIKKGYDKSK